MLIADLGSHGMGYAHTAPGSDASDRPQRKITALEFTGIDVDPNPEPEGSQEGDDIRIGIVNTTSVDVAGNHPDDPQMSRESSEPRKGNIPSGHIFAILVSLAKRHL